MSEFKDLELERQMIYTKIPENVKEYIDENQVINGGDVTLDDLVDAFNKFLERQKLNKPLSTKVTSKEITVEHRRKSIRKILVSKGKVNFMELFDIINKEYVVVTFLAVLEMAKAKELIIKQENNFDDIICEVTHE